MKTTNLFFRIAFSILLLSCNSTQNDAAKQAQEIQNAVKQNSPLSIPTSPDGITLTAKIDGKEWKATGIMPPDRAGLIVGSKSSCNRSLCPPECRSLRQKVERPK